MRSFSDSLTEAKEKLEKLGVVPKLVLMTGSASRMKFTHLLCQEMFPEPEPERCIAMGLARVGRKNKIRTLADLEISLISRAEQWLYIFWIVLSHQLSILKLWRYLECFAPKTSHLMQ